VKKRGFLPRWLLITGLLLLILAVAGQLGWYGWGAYQFRAAESALARRDFTAARRHLDHCLQIWSDDGETLLLAAQAARRDGATKEALRLLDGAQAANAVPEAVAFERDLVRILAGDLAEADYYIRVAETHPESFQAPLILEAVIVGGMANMDLARAQQCLELWEKHQSGAADRNQGRIWRGELAIRVGDVDTAASHYRAAVEADPENDRARLRLAELLARYAPHEALTHLELLRQEKPSDGDVLFQLARCHRALGKHDEAAGLLDKVLTESPNDFAALLERGQIALDLQQAGEAEQWLRRAEKIQPERRDLNLALARCLQLAGKEDEAKKHRDKVAEIDAVIDERAKRLVEQGRLEK
jgi:tetratricopeptide (TPR) repeat protein